MICIIISLFSYPICGRFLSAQGLSCDWSNAVLSLFFQCSPPVSFFFFNLKAFFNVYLFLRARESESGGGAEREGDTESTAGSGLRAVSTEPDAGLELTSCEIMT